MNKCNKLNTIQYDHFVAIGVVILSDVNELIIECANFKPGSLSSSIEAWGGHIPFAAYLIKITRPSVFVELGTHYGDSYFAFCKSAYESRLETKCYAVDTWRGDPHAGFYDENVFKTVQECNKQYASFSSLLRMTFDDALSQFEGNSIDLLHIDGLHTYEAVKHDFESWKDKLSNKSIVIFHDIAVRRDDFGVWLLWEELKEKYSSIEFQHSNGLGVLYFGSEIDCEIKKKIDYCARPEIKSYFSSIGESVINQGRFNNLLKRIKEKKMNRPLKRFKRHLKSVLSKFC